MFKCWEWLREKNCLALTIYFYGLEEIRVGFWFAFPFRLSIDLWFFTIVLWWKSLSDMEMIGLLKETGDG